MKAFIAFAAITSIGIAFATATVPVRDTTSLNISFWPVSAINDDAVVSLKSIKSARIWVNDLRVIPSNGNLVIGIMDTFQDIINAHNVRYISFGNIKFCIEKDLYEWRLEKISSGSQFTVIKSDKASVNAFKTLITMRTKATKLCRGDKGVVHRTSCTCNPWVFEGLWLFIRVDDRLPMRILMWNANEWAQSTFPREQVHLDAVGRDSLR